MLKLSLLMLSSILFLIGNSSCTEKQEKGKSFGRQLNIPAGAFMVKGVNGFYWCKAEVHSHKNNAIISIYDPASKKMLLTKQFLLVCMQRGNLVLIEDLKNQVDYFDGNRFILKTVQGKDSCWLQ